MKRLTVYVDGSYDKNTRIYGYGMVIITDTELLQKKGSGIDTEEVWNVAGEVAGAVRAIEYALEKGYDKLTVCHDYEGIQKWADGEWKAKKTISKNYADVVRNARNSGLEISFRKIKAHSGDTYNEHADRLAKEAVESRCKGFVSGKTGYTGGQFTDTIITERKADLNGFTFGKAGDGHGFGVQNKSEMVSNSENEYDKKCNEYATKILNISCNYAKSEFSDNDVSAYQFAVHILMNALHQILKKGKEH